MNQKRLSYGAAPSSGERPTIRRTSEHRRLSRCRGEAGKDVKTNGRASYPAPRAPYLAPCSCLIVCFEWAIPDVAVADEVSVVLQLQRTGFGLGLVGWGLSVTGGP